MMDSYIKALSHLFKSQVGANESFLKINLKATHKA